MKPQFLALLTAIAWGVGGYFEKRGLHLGNVPPQAGIFLRTAVALVVLGIASRPLSLSKTRPPWDLRTYSTWPMSPDYAQTSSSGLDRRSQIPAVARSREPGPAPSDRSSPAQFYHTAPEMARQGVLGRFELHLAQLARRPLHRPTRYGRPLAPTGLPLLLAMEKPPQAEREASDHQV